VAVAFGSPAGRELARRAATESLVLLTNDGVVPVDGSGLGRVAVVGPTADDPRLLLGDYHYPAHLEATTEGELSHLMPEVVTPLEGVRRALEGTGCEVVHARGCPVVGDDGGELPAAVEAAAGADLAVVCLGGRSGLTAEATVGEMRDAVDLRLTGAQLELLRAVHATGTRTIAVVVSGRVHTLAEVEAHSDAVLLAWVPGQEGGGAVADVLFGRVAPSGRLPVSLPRHVGQLPVHHGPRAGGDRSPVLGDYVDSPVAPLHPFGHGLTTTRFSYGEPQVVAGSTSEPTTVGVVVTNEGPRDGVEVVQCYVRDEVATVARPDRVLVGFARVPMRVGEQKVVTFRIDPSRLAFFDESMDLVCEPGAFTVELGGCAGDPAARATFDLDGPVTGHRQREVVPTEVTVTRPDPPPLTPHPHTRSVRRASRVSLTQAEQNEVGAERGTGPMAGAPLGGRHCRRVTPHRRPALRARGATARTGCPLPAPRPPSDSPGDAPAPPHLQVGARHGPRRPLAGLAPDEGSEGPGGGPRRRPGCRALPPVVRLVVGARRVQPRAAARHHHLPFEPVGEPPPAPRRPGAAGAAGHAAPRRPGCPAGTARPPALRRAARGARRTPRRVALVHAPALGPFDRAVHRRDGSSRSERHRGPPALPGGPRPGLRTAGVERGGSGDPGPAGVGVPLPATGRLGWRPMDGSGGPSPRHPAADRRDPERALPQRARRPARRSSSHRRA